MNINQRENARCMYMFKYIAPVNILPTRGVGGCGHIRGFRQKTIHDRREFDKLMESGPWVLDFCLFLHPRI